MEKNLTALWPQSLLTTQSLTAALKASGAAFSVHVRFQGESEAIAADERLAARHYVREVELHLDGIAVVWARSVCAADAQGWREVLDCGNASLGARLFGGDVAAVRSAFEYLTGPVPIASTPVYMRRSRFYCAGEELLLTEAFLPALAPFLQGKKNEHNHLSRFT